MRLILASFGLNRVVIGYELSEIKIDIVLKFSVKFGINLFNILLVLRSKSLDGDWALSATGETTESGSELETN